MLGPVRWHISNAPKATTGFLFCIMDRSIDELFAMNKILSKFILLINYLLLSICCGQIHHLDSAISLECSLGII